MTSTFVGYAFVLGLVGVLNPCGFPLLPAYLALFATGESLGWHGRLLRGIRAGGCMSVGFVAVFTVLGLLTASAVAAVVTWLPWLMIVIGGALVIVGVLGVLGRGAALRVPALGFRSGRGALAMFGFGASYALASLSCSLPLFLAGVFGVFTTASFVGGVSAFVAYALGMGLFVTAASVAASFVGGTAVSALRPVSRVLPKLAAVIVFVVGAYLVFYWMHTLTAPTAPSAIITTVQGVQNAVSTWVGASSLPLAIGLGVVMVACFITLAAISAKKKGSADA